MTICWIRTADLWSRKQPLYHPSHNHFLNNYLSVIFENNENWKWKTTRPRWLALIQNNSKRLRKSVLVKLQGKMYLLTSVTRFGEISTLWSYVIKHWPFWNGSFTVWQNFELTLAIFIWFWANVQCCKWPNIEPIN